MDLGLKALCHDESLEMEGDSYPRGRSARCSVRLRNWAEDEPGLSWFHGGGGCIISSPVLLDFWTSGLLFLSFCLSGG